MEAICLAVPHGVHSSDWQKIGRRQELTMTNDATRRPALQTGATTIFVYGRSVHVPFVVLISLKEDADAQSVR